MEKPRTIKLHKKLLEREEQFTNVYAIEQEILEILIDRPYPFELRDDLPSLQKRKKSVSKKQLKHQTVRLRKLSENEIAYQVVYIDGINERTESHTVASPIELLINRAIGEITVIQVATLNSEMQSVETLFSIS